MAGGTVGGMAPEVASAPQMAEERRVTRGRAGSCVSNAIAYWSASRSFHQDRLTMYLQK